ncbi:hypothetical protein [Lentzea cavernae]|nr:hypothetical protein [Lentzea cavernae]
MTAEFVRVTPNDVALVITLDATPARSVAPLAGFEAYVDSSLAATATIPGGVDGRHEPRFSLKGGHNVEVRLRPDDPGRQTDSV